jgi:hypothetical protein
VLSSLLRIHHDIHLTEHVESAISVGVDSKNNTVLKTYA